MAATATPSRASLETILQRVESSDSSNVSIEVATVTILKAHHDVLVRMANEYTALKDALLSGGITHEALEVLINGRGQDPILTTQYDDTNVKAARLPFHYQPQDDTTATTGTSFGSSPPYSTHTWRPKAPLSSDMGKSSWHNIERDLSPPVDDDYFFSEPAVPDVAVPDGGQMFYPNPSKPSYGKYEQRSVAIKNLADRTTHSDIAGIVRGGLLLEIFLRTRDRLVSVSFLEGSAAAAFMQHVKRHDIYLHGKRLEFTWHDRQFTLPNHVAGKINIGATRNLVVRGINPNITADRIREDLDHILNLVVIEVNFDRGDAFISLNSVHNALYARTCMMSRAAYKGMRIEWYPDECALPLPKTPYFPKKAAKATDVKHTPTMLNRFQLLNIDGANDESDTEDDDGLPDFTSLPDQKSWINEGVAV